ncbi:MAG TPA: ribbon-helix-helix protein, CopG family [Terriglobales bacterium]|nr:ribbon-helix-helix protein, CopG family [Terriglobales bacterium]
MRTSKTISISLPPAQLRKAEQLARRENRTMSELVREALRRYEESAASAGADRAAFALALKAVQQDAARKGVNRLSLREINAEIAAVRKERSRKAPVGGSSGTPRAERASPAASPSRSTERPTGATQRKSGPATAAPA